MEVNELAELLGVSKVTIRKDLDCIETRGMIHRQHGFAEINNQDDLNYRLATNYALKKKIAVRARNLVSDDETISLRQKINPMLFHVKQHWIDVQIHRDKHRDLIVRSACYSTFFMCFPKQPRTILVAH